MTQTPEGYQKWKANMIKKLGSEDAFNAWRKENSAKGGRNHNPKNPSNFKNNPALASKAGKKSAAIRANVDQPEPIHRLQYKNERQEEIPNHDKHFALGRDIAKSTRKRKAKA